MDKMVKLDVVSDPEEYLEHTHKELWKIVTKYMKKSGSTGCNKTDYATLYKNIRKHKFKEVLECGTGVSTIVIAYALYENMKETGIEGKVTSMESIQKYYDQSKKLLPKLLNPYVDILYSPIDSDYHTVFRGIKYKDVPDKQYDFCWIDGPSFKISTKLGRISFNFDFINAVRNSEGYVCGLVDGRYSTIYTLQLIFGVDKVKVYDSKSRGEGIHESGYCGILGVIDSVNAEQLKTTTKGNFFDERVVR